MRIIIGAVGTLNEAFIKKYPTPDFNKKINYLMPGLKLTTCSAKANNFYKEESGSSMAAALVSGMIAHILKFIGPNPNVYTVRAKLNTIPHPYTASTDLKSLTLLKTQ